MYITRLIVILSQFDRAATDGMSYATPAVKTANQYVEYEQGARGQKPPRMKHV